MSRMMRIIGEVLAVGCILFCIGTYVCAGQYVQPSADDFGISFNTKQNLEEGVGYLASAIEYTIQTYQEWQGSYSAVFILYATAIMVRYGIDGLKIFSVIIILCFYTSIIYTTRTVIRHCTNKEIHYNTLIISAILVFTISNVQMPTEIFYWYNVICIYTIPLICCMLGSAFLIRYWDVQKNYYLILSCLCGIVTGGGSLQCAAIICYIYMIIALYCLYQKKACKSKIVIAFFCAFFASVINVIAPGNYARYDTVDGKSLHLLSAIKYAGTNAVKECGRIATTPYLILILFLGFIVGYHMKIYLKISIKDIVIIGGICFGSLIISNFPVALGYSSDYMEARGYNVLGMLIVIGILIIMILLGVYGATYEWKYMNSVAIVGMVLLVGLTLDRSSMPVAICAKNIQDGTLKKFDKMWDDVFAQIENSDEIDLVIKTKHFPNTMVLKDPDFSTDASYWVNKGVAQYYGKDTIALQYIE